MLNQGTAVGYQKEDKPGLNTASITNTNFSCLFLAACNTYGKD
jgi:hypothetical protein